jgi:hypothetical protein
MVSYGEPGENIMRERDFIFYVPLAVMLAVGWKGIYGQETPLASGVQAVMQGAHTSAAAVVNHSAHLISKVVVLNCFFERNIQTDNISSPY